MSKASYVRKSEVGKERESPQFLRGADAQYDRCMNDNPLMQENKQRNDLTLDEIAEFRCKSLACRLQLCLTVPSRFTTQLINTETGQTVLSGGSCLAFQDAFFTCVEEERAKLSINQ